MEKIFDIHSKNILITSTDGYLGSYLSKELKKLGPKIIELNITKNTTNNKLFFTTYKNLITKHKKKIK